MIVKNMRFVKMYTRTECELTTFEAVKTRKLLRRKWNTGKRGRV